MEINLLEDGYRNSNDLFEDFVNNTIDVSKDYFSKKLIQIDSKPDFPIYLGKLIGEEREAAFFEAVNTLKDYFIETDRDIHLNGKFWHSYLIQEKRDYIIEHYPYALENQKKFNNVVLKNFDWENYIFKCMLAAEYINEQNVDDIQEQQLIRLIYNNFDMFNYLIKYNLFRNSQFIINFLKIIDDNNLTSVMKAKIKDRPDLGADERIGRRVILELNNRYPVLMSPLLSYSELEYEVKNILKEYI